jgi:hypothetical protein
LGIEGRLSEIEFSKARELDTEEFNNTIKGWCTSETFVDQVAERFTQIKDFDSRQDFEKIVNGIFYLANLPVPTPKERPYPQFNGYYSESLATLLGREDIIKVFFNNDLNLYKSYLVSLFELKIKKYEYRHVFLNHCLHTGYYSFGHVFSSDEISSMLYYYFKDAIDLNNKISGIWHQFNVCEIRKEKPTGINQSTITYEINEDAIKRLRKFICEKDLDGFIEMCLNKTSDGNYILGNFIKEIFKSNEVFIRLLKRYKGSSAYKEKFIKYYEEFISAPENRNKGIPFDFNLVPSPQYF